MIWSSKVKPAVNWKGEPGVKFILRDTESPGASFSKAPESFRARKPISRSSVSKNGEVYTPETSCMKGTSLHL